MQNLLDCGMSGCQNYPIRIFFRGKVCRRQRVLVFLVFKLLVITQHDTSQHEVPFINRSEATKGRETERRTANAQMSRTVG